MAVVSQPEEIAEIFSQYLYFHVTYFVINEITKRYRNIYAQRYRYTVIATWRFSSQIPLVFNK